MESAKKKLRIEPESSALRCATYFDSVSTDIRLEMIKWLNEVWKVAVTHTRPSYTAMENLDSTRFVRLLFSEKSPFRDTVSSMFTEIRLILTYGRTDVIVNFSRITIGPELFEGEALETGIAELVLKVCGTSAKKISISSGGLNQEIIGNRVIEKFASLVIEHCPNVQELEYQGPLACEDVGTTLCAAYFSQLRSIDWQINFIYDSLRVPDFRICRDIRYLSLPATPQLVSVLQSCGTSLETLTVSFSKEVEKCAEVVDAIELSCRKLKHISLIESNEVINVTGEERYASFLCSYGAQLMTAEVYGLSAKKMLEISMKCPNLQITSLTVGLFGNDDCKCFSILAPSIESLAVIMTNAVAEECPSVIARCTNLSELKIYGTSEFDPDPTMNMLSSLSSCFLKELELVKFTMNQQNISMIASSTSSLRKLNLSPDGTIKDGIDFRGIMDSNPYLQSVSIREDFYSDGKRDPDSAVEMLGMLVETFSKCRELWFDILNTSDRDIGRDKVRDICGTLPCRGVDVDIRIGSTYYQQIGRL